MKTSLLAAALFFGFALAAQTQFVRKDSVPVYQNNQLQDYAWAGGLNYAQFSPIDLNQDGIMDLFAFDRTGNKITTYINTGVPNQVSYVLAMQYVSKFPRMHDWVLLRDYNCDGKMDIFTSNASKVEVYKNISTLQNGLQFQLVSPGVLTDLTPNSTHNITPLNVSWIDIPVIRDVDGDGDLDVLNFGVNGYQVEFHRNLSEELYGSCDSLKFRLETLCWGEFTESQLDATITLNTPCSAPPLTPDNTDAQHNPLLHAGSCMECMNIDGDGDVDLIVGDLTNPFVNVLRNGGTSSYSIADSVDTQYPSYDTSVTVQIFACGFHLDVNNDGKRDLIFSPNSLNSAENFLSTWYYENTGADNAVHAHFVEKNFLQGKMIEVGEGAYPVFFDYDSDGDQDLFIGNKGYFDPAGIAQCKIALYENTGTATNPVFTFKTRDFAGIYAQSILISGMAPTFGDLDGDGDADLLVGDVNGKLNYFRKDAGSDTDFVFVQAYYQGIDIGNYASPQLVDVDHDGKLDLLIGTQTGNVRYYHNDGTTTTPVFTLVTAVFGNVDVRQPSYTTGHSTPHLFTDNGHSVLLVGSERGYVYRYDSIDGNLAGNFTLSDSMYVSTYEGGKIVPAVADLDGDGLFDVLIGNYAGGVSLFYGDNTVSIETYAPAVTFSLYPNPANEQLVIETGEVPFSTQTFRIYDLSGKEILSQEIFSQRTTINTSTLAAGIYIADMTDKKGFSVNKKLIINH